MVFFVRRPLLVAFALSLLLHLVLFYGPVVVSRPQLAGAGAVIHAVIETAREDVAARKAPESPVGKAVAADEKKSVEHRQLAVPKPAEASVSPHAVTASTEVLRASGEPSSPVVPSVDATADAGGGRSAEAVSPGATGVARTSEVVRDGVSAEDMRQYRSAVGKAARRFKRYPALAKERGWEGTVELEMVFRAALPTPEISLARSSGYPVLDEQAREMMVKAARATVLPESMRGKDFRFSLPISFELSDDQ